jgi:hypothetical protein
VVYDGVGVSHVVPPFGGIASHRIEVGFMSAATFTLIHRQMAVPQLTLRVTEH